MSHQEIVVRMRGGWAAWDVRVVVQLRSLVGFRAATMIASMCRASTVIERRREIVHKCVARLLDRRSQEVEGIALSGRMRLRVSVLARRAVCRRMLLAIGLAGRIHRSATVFVGLRWTQMSIAAVDVAVLGA